jgi:O-antigen ligase
VSEGSFKEKISSDGRILIWKSALEVIKKNPVTGVGIGDVRDELMEIYENVGDEDIIKSRYNAHNQFLEIAVEGGLISLFIFLSLVVYMIYTAISRQNLMFGQFLIIIMVFFMFETVLYRLAGVSFFSVFSFLLLYYNPSGTTNKDY